MLNRYIGVGHTKTVLFFTNNFNYLQLKQFSFLCWNLLQKVNQHLCQHCKLQCTIRDHQQLYQNRIVPEFYEM